MKNRLIVDQPLLTPGEPLLKRKIGLSRSKLLCILYCHLKLSVELLSLPSNIGKKNNVYFIYFEGKTAPIREERKCLLRRNSIPPARLCRARRRIWFNPPDYLRTFYVKEFRGFFMWILMQHI